MSTIADRVSAGIALLDEEVPNWRDKINLATLELRTDNSCILGQIFGPLAIGWESGFAIGCKKLNLNPCGCWSDGIRNSADYGFNIDGDDIETFSESDDVFAELQSEWERQLSA